MVAVSKQQMDEQARLAFVAMAKQWEDMMYMAKNCPHVRGFSYIGPDSITIEFSEKCPWMKFRARLQQEVSHAVNPV